MDFHFEPIAYVRSCFTEKFGIPRQSGLAEHATASLEFVAPYDDAEAFVGLEGVTHLWVQFVFHQNRRQSWKPRVKAPRLGGNKTTGVFATRSPTRPNPIGLSVVKLQSIESSKGKVALVISGHDLLDGTPVLDVKPYVPYADCITDAINPFAASIDADMPVLFSAEAENALEVLPASQRSLIIEVLQLDPRPAFHSDLARSYGTTLEGLAIKWRYEQGEACLCCIVESITSA